MPIDCMYKDAGPVEASWTVDLSTAAALPIHVPRPAPPRATPFSCQFSHARLCRAQMNHSDKF